jgi:cation transport ATPase
MQNQKNQTRLNRSSSKTKKSLNKRAVVSLTLLFSFVLLSISGLILIPIPHGTEIGKGWLHLHAIFGIVFIVAGIYHTIYNWRAVKHYIMSNNNKGQ